MKTITRETYLNRIIELNGTPDIKIITGIRRSGKSKLMQAYIAYLKNNFEDINIIFIDFMDLAFEEIKEYHALHSYVEAHYQEGKTNYLFVDEVQMCPKFELAINSLYAKSKYDIYITGSNAFLLSADLATLFTGRYIEIHVFPFSFQEYCQYYDDIHDIDRLFEEYTVRGGLSGSYAYRTEKDRTNYIKEVYETIVTRDLVQKYALPDTLVLQRLSEFLMDNISNLTSPNKVSQLMTANHTVTNHVTVGKYIKYLCNAFIFYDVKKVKAARKATEDAKRRTEEIMESRHKLLLSVSHDIKAPLSSIIGYLELMHIDSNSKDDMRMISSMKNSSEHILSLLTNLLNFSRLDQGKETPILSDFSIVKLCDELSEMFSPLAENKHLSFIYINNIEDNIHIKSDALKLKQILSNLLSNAIKYTNEGNVRFDVSKDESNMIFRISDEGIGIPQNKLEDIFKPFNRIDNKESLIEGNGFGLFVVKGLVELLDGDIIATSELGKGSDFMVKIPVKFVTPENVTLDKTIDIDIMKSHISRNILVVDDDNTLLSVIESMLKKLNINCDICHSSIDFDRYCNVIECYDFILTDREMGAFNGLDVLKKVKDIDPCKKVILMTARSEYNKDVALSKGFDGYIRKPFSIKDLAESFNIETSIIHNGNGGSKYKDDFPELCSMFENDDNSIENILRSFVETSADNLLLFNEIISEDDFDKAVNLCHKMYPIFVQLNQKDSAAFLFKMDSLRGKDKTTFPEWKQESITFMNAADDFINYLSERYDIE